MCIHGVLKQVVESLPEFIGASKISIKASFKSDSLFDMDSVSLDSPRLAAIKAADIKTHLAPHMEEEPWLAIPMNAARERLKAYITKDEPFNTVADITASFGSVLDDCGMLFYGDTEREAQDAALGFVSNETSPDAGATE
jgi:hypothetical protein